MKMSSLQTSTLVSLVHGHSYASILQALVDIVKGELEQEKNDDRLWNSAPSKYQRYYRESIVILEDAIKRLEVLDKEMV